MYKNIVPAAVIALATLATTAGSALAHEAIIERQGFDTALAQATGQPQAKQGVNLSQINVGTQPSNSTGLFNPGGASSNDDEWFKDR